MAVLRVIAAAVVEARELLLVSKRAAPAVYYLPGGKPEADESMLACLHREVEEELGVGVRDAELFAHVRAPAALEGIEMLMTVFLARLTGTPAPAAEIASLLWWPAPRQVVLAPAIERQVVPRLRRAGVL